MISWFRDHSTAVLATALAVAKAGVLGKGLSAVVIAVAAALGG